MARVDEARLCELERSEDISKQELISLINEIRYLKAERRALKLEARDQRLALRQRNRRLARLREELSELDPANEVFLPMSASGR